MNAKRIALLCAVILLFAAPSWAAGIMPAEMPEIHALSTIDEPAFERAFVADLSTGTAGLEMVKKFEWGGAKVGIIETMGEQFIAREWPNGARTIEHVDRNADWECGVIRPALAEANKMEERVASGISDEVTTPPLPTTIDILVQYEPSAAEEAGGDDMLHAEVLLAMDGLNETMQNSGLPWLSFRIVAFVDLRYNVPATNDWWPLSDVNIQLNRDFYQADLVSVIVSDWYVGGSASFFFNGDSQFGYSVVARGALPGGTFAHEIGHNLGLDHEPAYSQDEGFGLPDFNKSMYLCFGSDPDIYHECNIRGIMSYGAGPDCYGYSPRRNKIPGDSVYQCGVQFWSDIARQSQVVEMYAATIAQYREAIVTGPCVPNEATYCLDSGPDDNRFEVTIQYASSLGGGISGVGRRVVGVAGEWNSSQTALFYFIAPSNLEVTVKVINACGFDTPRFWVFISDMTDIGYTVTVRDTASNATRAYTKQDLLFPYGVKDFYAFLCP